MSKKDQFAEDTPQEPDAPESFFPEPGPGMGKEVKIGLAVIFLLLTVFGVLLVKRLRRPAETPAAAEQAVAKAEHRSPDKLGGKVLPPAVSLPTSGAATLVAGKAGPTGLPTGGSTWNPSADKTRFPDLTDNNRPEAPRPSPMPKPEGVAGNDRSARPGGGAAGDSPLRPWAGGQMSNTVSGAGSQQPFDPLGKPPAAVHHENRPMTVQVDDISARPNPIRDGGRLAGPPERNFPMPGGAAGDSLAGDSRGVAAGPLAPGSSGPASISPSGGPSPDVYQAVSKPQPSTAPVAATTAAFAHPGGSPGLKPFEGDAGRRPDGTYVVRANDNYWTISQRLYGTGAYFRALAEHNRQRIPDENRLTPGDSIAAPSTADLERSYPSLCPRSDSRTAGQERPLVSTASAHGSGPRTYVVQEGDNLFNIAKYELHSASRWSEIYDLNRDLLGANVDRLTPGMRLTLPDTRSPAARTAVQDAGPGMRR